MRSLLDFLCSKVHKTQAKFHPHLNPNWLVSDGSKAQVRIWSTLFPEWKRHDLIRALKILYKMSLHLSNTTQVCTKWTTSYLSPHRKGNIPLTIKNGRKSKWYKQPITVWCNLTKFADVEKMLFAPKKYWADSVWPENALSWWFRHAREVERIFYRGVDQ